MTLKQPTQRAILFFGVLCLSLTTIAQTTHTLKFDSTWTVPNTDTTLNVSVGDGLDILHFQDDDDFEVIINGVDTLGAYNITPGATLFDTTFSGMSITSIKVIYYDPNQYMNISLAYASNTKDLILQENTYVFPNPVSSGGTLYLPNTGDGTVLLNDLNGRLVFELPVSKGEVKLPEGVSGVFFIHHPERKGVQTILVE